MRPRTASCAHSSLRIALSRCQELLSPLLQCIRRVIATFLIKQSGLQRAQAHSGAFTLIQRILKLLTRTGYLIEEQGMRYLAEAEADRALTPLQAAACTYRIALGPQEASNEVVRMTVP
jgi:hypothetical protein